ncbi:Meiotically up-regulated protein 86 protein [Emydomyces testavorans]|uniref:Meiotically up-regulated protein 86 protein n=1 Tax=Emydomyces testavorans TaxID=2070801 RepID=A0AAF0IJR9_9EURO|nr:Meiotically up-regulated protein 86 protein [Emydomyces testavorans]
MSPEADRDAAYNMTTKSSIPTSSEDGAHAMSKEERDVAEAAARYGYGPLAPGHKHELNAFATTFHPSLFQKMAHREFANPAPLGLSAFALTTFVLSLINMQARGTHAPNLVIASAFGYGGLVQLLAGMWEMAVGNTFGATALSSYGGFWISYGIIFTPGGFEIVSSVTKVDGQSGLNSVVGFWLIGWFIFTTIMLILTIKSSWAFFLLFLFLDLAFLMLAIGHFQESAPGKLNVPLIKAGGFFGLLAAFLAWYNAIAAIANESNSFFRYPLGPLPWANAGRPKTQREMV